MINRNLSLNRAVMLSVSVPTQSRPLPNTPNRAPLTVESTQPSTVFDTPTVLSDKYPARSNTVNREVSTVQDSYPALAPHRGQFPMCVIYNAYGVYGSNMNQSKAFAQAFLKLNQENYDEERLKDDPLEITYIEFFPKNWREFMDGKYWKFIDVYLTEPKANLINRCVSEKIQYPDNWQEFLSDHYRDWASLI